MGDVVRQTASDGIRGFRLLHRRWIGTDHPPYRVQPNTDSAEDAMETRSKSKEQSHSPRDSRGSHGEHGSRTTTDRDTIVEWAQARGAKPSCVKGTGGK